MNRREMLAIAGFVSGYGILVPAQARSSQETDPWIGTYLKYARYDTHRTGQFGEAQTITISKNRDGYTLSKPYHDAHFTEVSKGVLSDGKSGLGKIVLGSVEYSDKQKATVLRVDFCYEDFVLYRDTESEISHTTSAGK